MGFKGRRKGKFEIVEKFMKRMKKIQKKDKSSARESTGKDKEICRLKVDRRRGI